MIKERIEELLSVDTESLSERELATFLDELYSLKEELSDYLEEVSDEDLEDKLCELEDLIFFIESEQ